MSIIIGLSGKKQSGKGTLCKFLTENVNQLFEHPKHPTRPWKSREPIIKTYSLATPLKEFCHEVLGLTREQCWGTDSDKNSETRFKWEELPHYPRLVKKARERATCEALEELSKQPWWCRLYERYSGALASNIENRLSLLVPTGPMTGRQILQEVGTGIVRQMWPDAWNQTCLKTIALEGPDIALIDDCRFEDEVLAIQRAGGYVFRALRAPFAEDAHASEIALDSFAGFNGWVPDCGVRDSCLYLAAGLVALGVAQEPEYLKFPDGLVVRFPENDWKTVELASSVSPAWGGHAA